MDKVNGTSMMIGGGIFVLGGFAAGQIWPSLAVALMIPMIMAFAAFAVGTFLACSPEEK